MDSERPLGIVTGLESEARIARRLRLPVQAGGGQEAGAEKAAAWLVAQGVRGLISFGLAGGLDPTLAPGTLLVPDVILSEDGHWPTDPLLSAGLGRVGGALFSGGSIVATAGAKRVLFQRTGASAVDMESAAVARVAARHALPFAALRAVCDPAGRNLPPAALLALDGAGRIGLLRVAGAVLRHPGQLPALMHLAGDAARARKALVTRIEAVQRLESLP